MIKPYAIFISKNDARRKFALDRSYTLIKGSCDYTINLDDIVQVDDQFFPTFQYQYPEWAEGHKFMVLWTNYYD